MAIIITTSAAIITTVILVTIIIIIPDTYLILSTLRGQITNMLKKLKCWLQRMAMTGDDDGNDAHQMRLAREKRTGPLLNTAAEHEELCSAS